MFKASGSFEPKLEYVDLKTLLLVVFLWGRRAEQGYSESLSFPDSFAFFERLYAVV